MSIAQHQIINGDCLEVMRSLPDDSVDAIIADPPYFKVKNDAWDRQWAKTNHYLDWLAEGFDQWRRLLKPNGSVYCFCWWLLASRVESLLSERFEILNHITWVKTDKSGNGMHNRQCRAKMRAYFPQTERILFAGHRNADSYAKGEAGYHARCDQLRGFVFEPLRKYFADEMKRCGISMQQIMDGMAARGCGRFTFARHTFTRSQWAFPTRKNYEAARDLFNSHGKGEYLRREYECLRREYECLRREYECLRREYECLRRPFAMPEDAPHTDVWTFHTVSSYPGKHPCEKPLAMIRHMVRVSVRPGGVVLDPFGGSGSTMAACELEGRRSISIEKDRRYVGMMHDRLKTCMGGLFGGTL